MLRREESIVTEEGEDGFFLQSVKRLRLARVQLSRTWTPGAKTSGGTKQIDTALPDVLPGRAAVLHRKAIQADRPSGSSWRSIAFFL